MKCMEVTARQVEGTPRRNLRVPRSEFVALWRLVEHLAGPNPTDWYVAGVAATLASGWPARRCRPSSEVVAARFPTPESLASLAGVTPSTRQSEKMKTTSFRWSADKQLRDAVCDFAADTRHTNAWAAQLYQQARARGHRHPHAGRIVARAWIHVIWRCWQDHQPYDPARHRPLQTLLSDQATPEEVKAA